MVNLKFAEPTNLRKILDLSEKKGPISNEKPAVLFLGDSFTYGIGVEPHKTFSYLFGEKIPSYETINAGVGNASVKTMYMAFNKFKDFSQVKMVIITIMDADMLRPLDPRKNISQDDLMDNLDYSEKISYNIGYLKKIIQICKEKKIKIILALWPRNPLRVYTNALNRFFEKFSIENKIYYIGDYREYLSVYSDTKLKVSNKNWHPSIIGHRLIAKRLLDFIIEKNLLKSMNIKNE